MSTDLIPTKLDNPFLNLYYERQRHKAEHFLGQSHIYGSARDNQPDFTGCMQCRFPEIYRLPTEPEENEFTEAIERKYWAWAVPSDDAIHAIAGHIERGIVEIGAGLGYWAFMLEQVSVPVIAYDIAPNGNHWCEGPSWYPVNAGNEAQASNHPDLALMLCWPPYSDDMAAHALEAYKGDTLIYVGEGCGGCTANDRFFALLGENSSSCYTCVDGRPEDCLGLACGYGQPEPQGWELAETVAIPQWFGLNDYLNIYKR